MTWFKVDDGFHAHPKLELLEDDPERYCRAVALWCLAGSWCGQQGKDGSITRRRVEKLLPVTRDMSRDTAAALVECGLWVELDADTYAFKNWAQYQPTEESSEEQRAAWRERKQAQRARERSRVTVTGDVTGTVTRESGTHPSVPSVPTNPTGYGASAREAVSPEPERVTWQRIGALFAERYLRATTRPLALHLHQPAFEAVTLESGGDLEAVERSLEAYWADPWAQEHGWPPAAWAKQFGRHLDGPRKPPDPAEQARRDAAAADAALAEAKREHDERYQQYRAREAERARERAKARKTAQGSGDVPKAREGPSTRGGEPVPLSTILGGVSGGE